jgi:tRNA dimethylallyltransferase
MAIARQFPSVIINADSIQLYRELRILSARPDEAAMAAVPHRLYGVLGADEGCSAERWRTLAVAEIAAAEGAGRLPLIVGGTGLYLHALEEGLAAVPLISAEVRAEARALLAREGAAALHRRLAVGDPRGAERIPAGDRQRLVRAWEVLSATGRSLSEWQQAGTLSADRPDLLTFVFLPPREELYAACDRRFAGMMSPAAFAEARRVAEIAQDPDAPVRKAIGLREILDHLAGRTDRQRLLAVGQQATRRYAKRQYTWFRRRPVDAHRILAMFTEALMDDIVPRIGHHLLTVPGERST